MGCILIRCHWQTQINIFPFNIIKDPYSQIYSPRHEYIYYRTWNVGLGHILYCIRGLILCSILCFMTQNSLSSKYFITLLLLRVLFQFCLISLITWSHEYPSLSFHITTLRNNALWALIAQSMLCLLKWATWLIISKTRDQRYLYVPSYKWILVIISSDVTR